MSTTRQMLALAVSLVPCMGVHAQDDHAAHAAHAAASVESSQGDDTRSAMDHATTDQATMDHATMDHAGMDHSGMGHVEEGQVAPATRADESRPPSGHVAPPPPSTAMHAMSAAEMVDVMGMDDRASWGLVAFDRLESVEGGALAWSARADVGGDRDRLRLRTEGERADGRVEHADIELLWSHAIAPFWDSQLGVRHDLGVGPDRDWIAFGVQGLAPYWFELGATAYVGDHGRTALRAEVEYELLLTQRLVLQPRVEINAYGRPDPAAGLGAGLSDAEFGLRLRWEIRRELAPYVGIERHWLFGGSADHARAGGDAVADTQLVAGVRFWF